MVLSRFAAESIGLASEAALAPTAKVSSAKSGIFIPRRLISLRIIPVRA
jgi:hypothetical protein